MKPCSPTPTAAKRIAIRVSMLIMLATLPLSTGCTSQGDTLETHAAYESSPEWPAAGERDTPLKRTAAEKRLRQKMRKKISVEFDQTPFAVAIERIRAKTDANIVVVWGALLTAGVEQDMRINLTLNDIRAETILALLCDEVTAEAGAYQRIGVSVLPEYVLVSTEADLHDEGIITVAYPIENLIREMSRPLPIASLMPKVDSQPKADGSDSADSDGTIFFGGGNEDDDDNAREKGVARILQLVRQQVGDATYWAANGGTISSIHEVQGHLWVKAPRHYHHELTELLARLRRAKQRQLTAQLRDNEVMMLLQRAERHRLRGEYDAALRLVNLAGNVDPHHPLARAMRETLKQARSNMQSGAASGSAATQPN